MGRVWRVADYGSGDFVNVLDEHGGNVAWQIQRTDAELIVRAVAALPDDEHDWYFDSLTDAQGESFAFEVLKSL